MFKTVVGELEQIGPVEFEIPVGAKPDMRVPARIFADEQMLERIQGDRSIEQLVNVATLPGVVDFVCGMPDMHEGYGFPVGGVAAIAEEGVISPGGVGYDINCGVRLLASDLCEEDVRPILADLVKEVGRTVPSGTGHGHRVGLGQAELEQVLARGCRYLQERGAAQPEDLANTEAGGALPWADPGAVSERAKRRGSDQLGTLGSGNHFIEIQRVDTLFDPLAARALGLRDGQVTVLIHTGSRGLGHQVCTDYLRRIDSVVRGYGIDLPDRQLAAVPLTSPEGKAYFQAMCAAANFAWANRQMITESIRRIFTRRFGSTGHLRLVYDVAHNIAKRERYRGRILCVHRKGATRAFGPGHPETPTPYRPVGQPVFIPGSMGTSSYVLVGTDASEWLSFGSTCHGAGRAMSRRMAKRLQTGRQVRAALAARGIEVSCRSDSELVEEAPEAYKDVERVVGIVHRAGIARRVARLCPIGVVKG